jgi:hypothetical protein
MNNGENPNKHVSTPATTAKSTPFNPKVAPKIAIARAVANAHAKMAKPIFEERLLTSTPE